MARRSRLFAVAVGVGVLVSGVNLGVVRLAEAKDPSPSKTAAPKAGTAAKHDASAKQAKDRTQPSGNHSRPSGGPYHDPPTGSARDSGPGSGAGL